MNVSKNCLAIKSGFWYILGNFVAKSAGLIATPIFTRLMTTGDIGDFSNIISWVEILIVIATLNLHSSIAVARFDYQDEIDIYISSNLILGSIITSMCYLLCMIFKEVFAKYTGLSDTEIHIAFMYLLFYPAMQMLLIKERISYKYKTVVILSLISAFFSTFLSLLFVVLFQNKLFGRICGYFIPLILIDFFVYAYFIFKERKIRITYWKYSLLIAIPYAWHTLSGNILGSSDRVMIKYYIGNEATAYYSIAYYCALIISVLWSAVNNAWSPWAYEQLNDGNQEQLKKVSVPLVASMIGIVFVFLLFAPELLFIMGGKAYTEAIDIIPPVMIAYVFQVVYSLYVNIEFYCKKQFYIAIGTSIAALTNILLNIFLIPVFGYKAAAYTTLAGYAMLFVIHFFFVKKMGYSKWLDSRFNFIALLFSLIIMIVSLIVYKFYIIRYCLISIICIALLVALIVLREEIYWMIKNRSIVKIRETLSAFFRIKF